MWKIHPDSGRMRTMQNKKEILTSLQRLSTPLNSHYPDTAIILAAGHGKRIKSATPKMLYRIWGVPTVVRVIEAVREGLETPNQIIVVGMDALDVAKSVGKRANTCFVFQEVQRGTGDAVRVALEALPADYSGNVYIFPGDMGLITAEALARFKKSFAKSSFALMVLTGIFKGNPEENYYGRVLKEENSGEVLEIKEYKDILSLKGDYSLNYLGRNYSFSKEELLKIREFNAGVYGFKCESLKKYISRIKPNNVQGEYYLTDLVPIFKKNSLKVGSQTVEDSNLILAFNNRVVLKRMENLAREKVYNELKNIISFDDLEDFFLAEEVAQQILKMDRRGVLADVEIGKGAYIDKGVKLSKGVKIGKNAHLEGKVTLGEGVKIGPSVQITAYPQQELKIGKYSEILGGDILKGNLQIGENCRIESWVRITGSDEYPVRIGKRVLIKGTTYIFGCKIKDGVFIENCVLKKKTIRKKVDSKGKVKPVRYIFPKEEGNEAIEGLA